jgi:type II secretory pathway component GspD/PulD (secretin)
MRSGVSAPSRTRTPRPLRRLPSLAAICLAASTLFTPALAQTSLPSQIEAARLIDLCAERLKLRISYDEASLKSKVNIRQPAPMSDADLWQFTNRVLAEQGTTTIRAAGDDTIAVVKLANAPQMARVESLADIRASAAGKPVPGFRRVLVPLQRASSKDAVAVVQMVLSKPAGVVAESEQAGFLIVADLTPSLDTALTLIEQLDSADGGAVVKDIPVRNVDAQRVVTLAKQIADKRKAIGGREIRGDLIVSAGGTSIMLVAPAGYVETWTSILNSVDQREPVERKPYSAPSFSLDEVSKLIEDTVRQTGGPASTDDRWRIIKDDLTGTLIITATPSQHDQIQQVLDRLSSVPQESRRPVRTFKLKNRAVKDVQAVVENLIRTGALEAQTIVGDTSNAAEVPQAPTPSGAGPQSTSRAGAGLPNAASVETSPLLANRQTPHKSKSRVAEPASSVALSLTSDESTNTLIAVGEARLLAQLAQLIPQLDVRQPQVMLEAILVSMTESQAVDFGVELEHLRISGDTAIRLSSLFGLSSAGTTLGERTRVVGDSSGFTGTILNPGDFSVVIRALESINKGRTLSRPRLLVSNNQQASFNSVLQQPFSSVNASNTVSTTSFGGTQDAGTTISVKPQIAEGDHLVLDYSISLSSFVGGPAAPGLPPPRQQNSVQSIATIPDGYTVVVGGLELVSAGDGKTQVPLIGDVPLVGELFKNRTKSRGRQRFYVFLRASVLRQNALEDLKYISDGQAKDAQLPPDWPVNTPRLIK